MAKKKRIKIGAMYREYGEMEGVLCRNCCNFTTIAVDGKHHCKCKAYGITREANTNWRSKYEACGLYNTPIGNKYNQYLKEGKSNEYTIN